jgi:hypothetical protein
LLEEIVPASTKITGVQAKIHATDQTSASALFTASDLNTALEESTVEVDHTVSASSNLITSIIKGTTTTITTNGVHKYTAGRQIDITGATVNSGTPMASLTGTFTVDSVLSTTEAIISANTSGEAGTYDANSATATRVSEVGNENESVLKDVEFSDVNGAVSLTVSRYKLICTVNGGVWTYTSGQSSAV